MKYRKINLKKFSFLLYITLTLIGVFIGLKVGIFLLPFIIAGIVSIITQPMSNFLQKKLKLSYKISNCISIVFFYLVFILIIVLSLTKLITEIYNLSQNLNRHVNHIETIWTNLLYQFTSTVAQLPPNLSKIIDNSVNSVINSGALKLNSYIRQTFTFFTSIPTIILYICITILSTFFISLDKKNILKFVEHQLPNTWIEKMYNIKKDLFNVLGTYIKAQLILMSLCFIQLFIYLSLLNHLKFNVHYPLLLSVSIAFIDALPILGAGAVLLPWSLFSLISGDYRLAIAIFIIYIILLSVRQMLEPKLISQNLGVHPLVTLISMYTGFKLIGIAGFLIGPLLLIILKNIFAAELELGFFKNIFSDSKETK